MSEQERSYTIVVFSDQRDGDLNNIVGSTTLEGFGEKFRRGNLYWEDHIIALSEMVMELILSYEDKVRKHKQPSARRLEMKSLPYSEDDVYLACDDDEYKRGHVGIHSWDAKYYHSLQDYIVVLYVPGLPSTRSGDVEAAVVSLANKHLAKENHEHL